jgi:hypothetical protein
MSRGAPAGSARTPISAKKYPDQGVPGIPEQENLPCLRVKLPLCAAAVVSGDSCPRKMQVPRVFARERTRGRTTRRRPASNGRIPRHDRWRTSGRRLRLAARIYIRVSTSTECRPFLYGVFPAVPSFINLVRSVYLILAGIAGRSSGMASAAVSL